MAFENYHLYRLALWIVRWLPRGFLYFFVGVVAELNFYINRTGRLGIYANLDHALGSRAGVTVARPSVILRIPSSTCSSFPA